MTVGTALPEGGTAAAPARVRAVLSNFPSGVAVVTAVHETTPVGFACQSFTSLSLDPPMVSFAVSRASQTRPRILAAGRFCVNILAADQQWLCRRFAARDVDRFRGVGWRLSASGSPVLDGVLAWIDCTVAAEYPAGDHTIVVGHVGELARPRETEPLVFLRGRLMPGAPLALTHA
ncbi:MAG TPA: flavin reductase family protein [Actinocrinis sp.]|jgi:flavin reductase (DIM6/NTAB) family NADH-FMN oxidoreductase RutF|uniref:flavin reductase family protein n=1 Tax=Actinocrinis sp. TaxID=1920516 RepID=UPI002DDD03D7|nr:flavin reductase family protein [Actinocrinis sp.]HEV3170363.1 flavin reductase family protein [Actinocrinis sp.]